AYMCMPKICMASTTVILKAKASVSDRNVYLSDIADVKGGRADEVSRLFIMKSPTTTLGAKISRRYIEEKIKNTFSEDIAFKGAEDVYVTQRFIHIPRDRIEAIFKRSIISASPWHNNAQIAIENIKVPEHIKVLERNKDKIQIRFSKNEDFKGLTTATLIFGAKSSKPKAFHISAMVKVFVDAPVATSTIRRGSIISPKDIEAKRIDITRAPPIVFDMKECIGMRSKSCIRKGCPILLSNIERPPIVSRGQGVIIEAVGANIAIRDKGIALKDGYLGQNIPVKNISSGRKIFGTVIAPSKIRVNF
ncbi:MAG: flagellar basal body P-ring formation protein FlgA, partial [Deltaproteobacteria bacterium]|nr:flagellar basal body P-ring formation protein FlgA [Deltaproteobacteria bacterium]